MRRAGNSRNSNQMEFQIERKSTKWIEETKCNEPATKCESSTWLTPNKINAHICFERWKKEARKNEIHILILTLRNYCKYSQIKHQQLYGIFQPKVAFKWAVLQGARSPFGLSECCIKY